MEHIKSYIEGYPRPQLSRSKWLNLNGEWNFKYKPEEINKELKNGFVSNMKINVPYTYETKLSGINDQNEYKEIWYSKSIKITKEQLTDVVLLHFEGSDYITTVFVNGEFVGENKGAYHRFSFDIRNNLVEGENIISVKIQDDYSMDRPRGKQRWKDKNFECFYVQTTGIWKTVWLEFLNNLYIRNVKFTADFNKKVLHSKLELSKCLINTNVNVSISFKDKQV